MLESYKYLRPVTIFAGIFGIVQSLIWFGMAVAGIAVYYCHIDFSNYPVNLSTMLDFTFFRQYFQGSCVVETFPADLDFTILNQVNTMVPQDLHAWIWVYLVISFLWLISSIVLLTNVKHEYIKYANIFLFTWILITLAVCILDFAIGILFGLDYNSLFDFGYSNLVLTEPITHEHLIITEARVAAAIMMVIAFRGFIVWLINMAIIIYFFRETFRIYDYNKLSRNEKYGQQNIGYVSEPHSMLRAHPIDAYNTNGRTNWATQIQNDPGRRERARSFSNTYDERRRTAAPFEQQQAPVQAPLRRREDDVVLRRDAAESIARELRHSMNNNPNQQFDYPRPDYSPVMQRGFNNNGQPPLRSALRSSRF